MRHPAKTSVNIVIKCIARKQTGEDILKIHIHKLKKLNVRYAARFFSGAHRIITYEYFHYKILIEFLLQQKMQSFQIQLKLTNVSG